MAFAVLFGSGFLLASLATLDHTFFQFALFVVFVLTGLAVFRRKREAFFVFIFLFPLLPSQSQLSSFDFLEFLFLSFAFWWAAERIRQKRWTLPRHPLNPVLALFLLVASISVLLAVLHSHYIFSDVFLMKVRQNWNIFSDNPSSELVSLHSLIHWFEAALLFWIALDLIDRESIEKTVRIVFYSGAAVALLGLFQYGFKFQLLERWVKANPSIVRINSTFSDPNSLGTYLAAIFCIGIFAHVYAVRKAKMWNIVLLIVVLASLIFTASRAAWAAVVMVLVLVPQIGKWLGIDPAPFFNQFSLWLARRGVYVAGLALAAFLLAGSIVDYRNPKPESLIQLLFFTLNPKLNLDEILKGRILFWNDAIEIFKSYPIFGCGIGAFLDRLRFAPYFVAQPENAHNNYLQILAETGATGLFLFSLILVLVFRFGLQKLRALDRPVFSARYGLLAALIAFLLTCITGHPLLLLKLQFVFWVFAAILMVDAPEPKAPPGYGRFFTPILVTVGLLLISIAFVQARSIVKNRRIAAYEHGYYRWERDSEGRLFRWTGSNAISILQNPGGALTLQMRQFNPEIQKKPVRVHLFANDQPLDSIEFSDVHWKDLVYVLPELKPGKPFALRIEPESSFQEHSTGGRELGIAVSNFTWKCVLRKPVGVFEMEEEGSQKFYWTGKRASFPLERSGAVLSFPMMTNVSTDTRPLTVRFFWNERPVKSMVLTKPEWQLISLNIPQQDSRNGHLTIDVSHTINPKKIGISQDSRNLGVRVEWPFQWSGTTPAGSTEDFIMERPRLYGIHNNQNQPLRLMVSEMSADSREVQVVTKTPRLPLIQGLFDSVTNYNGNWIPVYPETGREMIYVMDKLSRDVDIPPGPVMLRMTAKGTIVREDVPLASLWINDEEIARQPVISEDWVDYYFHFTLKQKRNKVTVKFLNRYHSRRTGLNRSLVIQRIDLVSKNPSSKIGEGWERSGNQIVVAESVDRNFPFQPQNICYTVRARK